MPQRQHPDHLGRYEIVRELGRGAMGVVYEGRDPKIGRRVAIKTARSDVLESTHDAHVMMERFLREARAAGVLNHPNIVTIYDVGEEGDTAYIAMEYVEGGDLKDRLRKKGPARPEEAVALGAALCRALAHAHKHGIIHRDIKPSNVMLPEEGGLKVADFGIAHMQGSELTRDGSVVGTPFYLSPEGFMGKKVDHRADLFACGVILYELLTGRRPFQGESMGAVMQQVINQAPRPPHRIDPKIPDALSEVVMKALSKEPGRRYADGGKMADALENAVKTDGEAEALGRHPDIEATVAMATQPGITVDAPPPDPRASRAEAKTIATPPPHKANQATHSATATVPQGQEETEQSARTLPTGSTERRGHKRFGLAAAFLVPLVLLGTATGIALLQGGGKPASEEPYWGAVEFEVVDAAGGMPLKHYTVVISDIQSNDMIVEKDIGPSDPVIQLDSEKKLKSFKFSVTRDNYYAAGANFVQAPASPGDKTVPITVQLEPKS